MKCFIGKNMRIINFKKWLIRENEREKIFATEDEWYDYSETMRELQDDIEYNLFHEILDFQPGDRVSWSVIPANRAKKIWKDYGELNIVRDAKGIQMIKDILITNINKLYLINAICGHDTFLPQDEWEDKFEMTPEEKEIVDRAVEDYYFFTYNNQDLISDYGLPKLLQELPELYKAKDEIEILQVSDRIFNIVHPRNDLAGFFIEGGSKTLYEMSHEGEKE